MKKLSKILATISTVTLLSCVWGVTTHAEVKKNGLGVPTHIEADDESEFLDNLKEVLEYINSRLESEEQQKVDSIHQDYTNWKPEEDNIADPQPGPSNPVEKKEYRFVLQAKQMTNPCAVGYLYQLLCKSKIAGKNLPGVWQLCVNYHSTCTDRHYQYEDPTCEDSIYRPDDIIFQLPYATSTYCVCNHRWLMIGLDQHYVVKPTKLAESFEAEVQHHKISEVALGIVPQNSKNKPIVKSYKANALQYMPNNDIAKLIEVSELEETDTKLIKRYLASSNFCINFAEFKDKDPVNQKLKPEPLAKK